MKRELFSSITTTWQTIAAAGMLCLAFATEAQPTSGLVAYYPFSGNANDLSGNNNNGTANGATLAADRFGNLNSAYSFDGVDDYIEVLNSPSLQISGDITAAVWVKHLDVQNAGIISKYGPIDAGWNISLNSCCDPGKVGFGGRDHSSTYWNVVSPGTLNDDQWHFIVGQRSGVKWKLFVDGVFVGEQTATGAGDLSTGNSFLVGRLAGAVDFKGVVDDIRIYDRALSPSEVSELYDEDKNPRLISFSPISGHAGTSVVITGIDFSTTLQDNAVFFGTARATVTAATTTSLTVTAPTNAMFAPIWVTSNGKTSYATKPYTLTFPGVSDATFGTSSFSTSVAYSLSAGPRKVVIGDLNGDGKSDLAVANFGSNKLTLLENVHTSGAISASSFSAPVNLTSGGNGAYGVAIGDLNSDGKPDIAVVNQTSNNVSVFENLTNSGTITTSSFATHVDLPTGDGPYDVAIFDVDQDGKPDIVTSNSTGKSISVLRNQMTGTTITTGGFAAKVDFAAGGSLSRLAVRDLDEDNKPEIVAANSELHQVSVFKNLSTPGSLHSGSFQAKVDFATLFNNPENVTIGDLNGDGKPEIAAANTGGARVSVFRNTATAGVVNSSTFAAVTNVQTDASPYNALMGDLTGDGKPDLTWLNSTDETVSIRRNTSTNPAVAPTFAARFQLAMTGANQTVSSAIGDLDGDGRPDIVAANYTSTNITVTQNLSAIAEPTAQPTSIGFSAVTHNSMTVGFTGASGSPTGYIGLTKATTSPTDVPADGTTYSVGSTIGASTVAFVGTGTSFNVTGLSPATLHQFDIFSYNAAGAYNYLTTSPLEGSRLTYAEPPSAQPSAIIFSSLSDAGMTVEFTAAAGPPTGYIALINATASPTEAPETGTSYTQGNLFGTSTVAYIGPDTSFPVSGLLPSTTYYFDIFAYNGATGTYNYLTSSQLESSQTTLAAPPSGQPTGVAFSSVSSTGMTVSFTAASGPPTGYLALINATGSPADAPSGGTSYSQGNPVGASTVAYVGPDISFPVTGLSASTIYYFDIFAYNGTTGTYNYLTSSPAEGSQTTYAEPPSAQPASLVFSSVSDVGMTVSFTAAAGPPTGYIAIINSSGSPTDAPTNGTTYIETNPMGASTVAYVGAGTSFSVTGLTPSTIYYFDIFAYNGTTDTYNYFTSSPAEGSQTTYAGLPTDQPSSIVFSSVSDDGMTVSFTAATGPPTGYLALINTSASPGDVPVNGTGYTQGQALGSSTVAFAGTGTSFSVSGLLPSTIYYFDIFAYNGTTGTYNYLTSSPAMESHTTLAELPSTQPADINFTSVSDGGMTVTFTAATDPPTGYIALFNSVGSPTEFLANGTPYTQGDPIGASTVAFVGSGLTFSVSGLSPSTIYYFSIFSYNGTTDTYNYLTSSPLESSQTTHALPPSGQPADIGFPSVADVAMTVSFSAAAGPPTGYIALMNSASSPIEIPVNGTTYAAGDPLGASTVVYAGTDTSFPVTGLSPATEYFFDIFSYNGTTGAYSYLTSSPLEGSQTASATPSAQPTNLHFSSVSDASLTIEFTAAAGAPSGYIGLLNSQVLHPEAPVNGNTYTAGDAIGGSVVAFIGSGTSYTLINLAASTTHNYTIFSYNVTTGIYNYLTTAPLAGGQTTLASEPTAPPAGTSFSSISDVAMTVSFSPAAGSPIGYIALIDPTGSPTFVPEDGTTYSEGDSFGTTTVAFFGSDTNFSVSGLAPQTLHYFDIYSFNGIATTYNYLTTSLLEGSQTTYAESPSTQPSNTQFTSVSDDGMTVTFTAASGSPTGYIALIDATGSPAFTPVDGTSYSAGEAFGTTTVAFVGTDTNFSVTGLSASTTYTCAIYSYNGSTGTYNYFTTSPLLGNQTTHAEQPSEPPTSMSFTSVSDAGMTVAFTPATGSPTGYIAFIDATASPTFVPEDGTSYSTGDSFGSTTVAFVGSATSFPVTGLLPQTVYYFDIFSYNGTTGTYNYLTSSLLEGSQTTYAESPSAQASNILFTSMSDAGMTVTFTAASVSPTGYIALIDATGAPTYTPVDGTSYSQGDSFATTTVAYIGPGTSFQVMSLSASTIYHFAIYSYNGAAGTYNYLTSNILTGSQSTYASQPTSPPAAIGFSAVSDTEMTLSLIAAGSPSGYLALLRTSTSPMATPVDGISYQAGTYFGDSYIAYNGSATDFTVSGLTAATIYYYDIFSYNGTTGTYNYLESSPLEDSRSTLASPPSFQPSNITFTSVSETSMTVNFIPAFGSPSGYIGLVRAGNWPDGQPNDGASYNPGDGINSSKVAFIGSGNSFNVTGLLPFQTYHFYIFSYNGTTTGTYNYMESSASQASQSTLATQPSSQPGTISFTSISQSGMTVNFSSAPGSPTGYIGFINGVTSPTEIPVDGTFYSPGDVIDANTTVAFVGTGTSYSIANLLAQTEYSLDIFSYNGTTGTYNYLTSSPREGSQTTYAEQPIAQPTNIQFPSVSETGMTVTFTSATGSPTGYIAFIDATASPTFVPEDGTSYSAGDSFGSTTVAFVGASTSFSLTALLPSTTYYCYIYSYNGTTGRYNYLESSPLPGSRSTLAPTPFAAPTAMIFSSVTASDMTVSFTPPAGSPSGYVVLRKAASSPTEIPVDGQFYQTGTSFGNSFVAYSGSNASFYTSGLNPATVYHYDVYSYNGTTGTYNYLESPHLEGSMSTLASEPSFAATGITFTSLSETAMTVNFTPAGGSPTGYICLMRDGTWPIDQPSDGVSYSPGALIGSSQVAFVGTGNSFIVTGLSPVTYYYFYIFAYNGTTGTYNYLTNGIAAGAQSTLATEPAATPTSITFSSVTASSMSVSFVQATGFPSGYIALRTAAGSAAGVPVDGSSYSTGTSIGNSTVVSFGNSTFFVVNGLAPGTTYQYDIFSYNEFNGTYNYHSSHLTGSRSTLTGEPSFQPGTISFPSVTETSMTVNFVPAAGAPTGYIALMRAGSFPFDTPSDGVGYSAESFINLSKVVYVGSGTSFTMNGLSPGTTYYLNIYSFNGATESLNYLTLNPSGGNRSTIASQPTAPPTGLNFTFVTATTMTVNFSPAPGLPTGYVVVRKAGSAPTEVPVDGTTYNAGDVIGNGTSVIAYAGSGTNISVFSLTAGNDYFYAVYSYNGGFGTYNYLESNPLTGHQATIFPEPTAQPGIITFSAATETGMTLTFPPAVGAPTGYLGFARANSSPTDTPIDGASYTPGTSYFGSLVAFFGTGTTFTVTGLLPSTVYYFDVFSYNGTTGAYNYLTNGPTENFRTTLAQEPTLQEIPISFTNVLRTTATLTYSTSTNATGYLVLRSSIDQADLPIDGTTYGPGPFIGASTVLYSGPNSVFNDTGLLPNTKYYYSVYAYNGSGLSTNYKTSTPLKGFTTTKLDVTLPDVGGTVGSSSSITSGQGANISVQLIEPESTITEAYVQFRYVAKGGAMSQLPLVQSGTNYTVSLPSGDASELGIEYKIFARNSVDLLRESEVKQIKIDIPSLTFKYSSFGDEASKYRIISVPADLDNKSFNSVFQDELGTFDEKKWRIYRYDNGKTGVVSSTTAVEPGKGYWLIARDNPERALQTGPGKSVAATTDKPHPLHLNQGWNQIGNPYNFNLKWQEVLDQNKDLGTRSLKVYNGAGYEASPVLYKMEGGFVYADKATDLVFPVVKNTSVQSGRTKDEPRQNDPNGWTVPLTLTQTGMTSSLPGIGMHRDASEGFDRYDDLSMPRFFDYLELNHYKKIRGNPLNLDVVPFSDSHTWEFNIESSMDDEDITISWPAASDIISPDLQMFLVDETEGVAVDMRLTRTYTFPSARTFRIVYGPEEYLAGELPEGKGKILSVYPNPARKELAAVVAIPSWNREFDVSIDIVNTLGQRSALIYSGTLKSGTHIVEWNGMESPPPGVYFVRMVCNGQVSIQRIVLL